MAAEADAAPDVAAVCVCAVDGEAAMLYKSRDTGAEAGGKYNGAVVEKLTRDEDKFAPGITWAAEGAETAVPGPRCLLAPTGSRACAPTRTAVAEPSMGVEPAVSSKGSRAQIKFLSPSLSLPA